MTETGGGFIASEEPRMIDTRAFGRPLGRSGLDLDARIVDRDDCDVRAGEQGELLVRRRRDRKSARRLLRRVPEGPAGDGGRLARRLVSHRRRRATGETGMLYFVDRNKNIIRRSGENIAAAEVEATLLGTRPSRRSRSWP